MMRIFTCAGLVVCTLLAGCDKANTAAKRAEEEAKKAGAEAKELAKESEEKAKVAVVRPIEEALPKIEDKIKGLSGEAATKAKEKLADLKRLLEEVKTSAPAQWNSLKERLERSFEELKKAVGF